MKKECVRERDGTMGIEREREREGGGKREEV